MLRFIFFFLAMGIGQVKAFDLDCGSALFEAARAGDVNAIAQIRGTSVSSHVHFLLTSIRYQPVSAFEMAQMIELSLEVIPIHGAAGAEFYDPEKDGLEVLKRILNELLHLPPRRQAVLVEALGYMMMRSNRPEEDVIQFTIGEFFVSKLFPLVERAEYAEHAQRADLLKPVLRALVHLSRGTRVLPELLEAIGDFLIYRLDDLKTRGLARAALEGFGQELDEAAIRRLYDLMEREPFAAPPPEGPVRFGFRSVFNLAFGLVAVPVAVVRRPPPSDEVILSLLESRRENAARIQELLYDLSEKHPNERIRSKASKILSGLSD